MMILSNVVQHPKTTFVGLLTGIVQIAAMLGASAVGPLKWVGVASGIATILLGALAKDPGGASSTASATSKMFVWALILLMVQLPWMTGCTQQQRISVAQEIVNWTPTFISTADLVNSSIEALDPATVVVLAPMTAAINAFGPEFQKAAQAYLANPSQTTLQVLQSLITQIQQDTNSALLAAARVTNPASQATATKDINLVATIANTLLSLIQSISSKAQVAAMAAQVHVTLAQVRPLLDTQDMQRASARVSADLQLASVTTPDQFFAYEAQAGF
jgi:CheY-like chemotaxis protein